MTDEPKRKRGFGSMNPERQREIAAKGGRSVPDAKRSFSMNRELASSAGRKGGLAVKPEDRTFSRSREAAVEAGRKGGHAAHWPGSKWTDTLGKKE
jgi:general stress protein YciG